MSSATSAKSDKVRLIGVGGVRSVSESSFDALHTEMVHYLAQQIAMQDKHLPLDSQSVKLYNKLESLGYSVGHRLSERYTKDVNWLSSELDMIKFVCKEFWLAVWKRQVDKLQTNYKGVYVLHDSHFRLVQHIRAVHPAEQHDKEREREQLDEQARVYVAFSCGVLRGALMNLGVTASVRADIVRGTGVSFTISDVEKTQPSGATTAATTSTTAAAPAASTERR